MTPWLQSMDMESGNWTDVLYLWIYFINFFTSIFSILYSYIPLEKSLFKKSVKIFTIHLNLNGVSDNLLCEINTQDKSIKSLLLLMCIYENAFS